MKIKGIFPAMITPMDKHGDVDLNKLKAFVEHLIESRVHGIVTTGTTGEFPYLSVEERMRILETTLESAENKPIIACVGHTDIRVVKKLAKHAEESGAAAILIPTPYYLKIKEDGVISFFREVRNFVDDILVYFYNIPQLTGNYVDVNLLSKMAEEGIIDGLKDTSGNLIFFEKALKHCRDVNREFTVLIGEDRLTYAALCLGADGGILGSANIIPSKMVELYEKFIRGEYKKALELQLWANEIIESMFIGTFPAAVKEAVNMLGFDVGSVRCPLSSLNNEEKAMLKQILERYL